MKKEIIVIVIILQSITTFSQEFRGGEIWFNRINSLSYELDAFFDLYYKSEEDIDRPFIAIKHQGIEDTALLISKIQLIDNIQLLRYSKRIVLADEIGSSSVSIRDTFFLPELKNLSGERKDTFFLGTFIHPVLSFFGPNNSPPVFTNYQTDYTFSEGVLMHNIQMSDPDGDTLFYGFSYPQTIGYEYTLPDASDTIYIDLITGDLVWDKPTEAGKYLIYMDILEYHPSEHYLGKRERVMIIEIKEEDIVLGLRQPMFSPLDIQVFPNPAQDFFNLTIQAAATTKARLRIHDIYGRKQVHQDIFLNTHHRIDTADWPSGVYFLTIETANGQWTKKVMVQ